MPRVVRTLGASVQYPTYSARIRAALLALLAIQLTACATTFYDAKTAGPNIEATAGLAPGTLKFHTLCFHAVATRGVLASEFTWGVCAYDSANLYVLNWDTIAKAYRREIELPFNKITGIAHRDVAIGWQLQIPVDGGFLVMDANNMRGIYDYLKQSGIPEVASPGAIQIRVDPAPTTIYIPVYVGG
jgi:hypothetical protein